MSARQVSWITVAVLTVCGCSSNLRSTDATRTTTTTLAVASPTVAPTTNPPLASRPTTTTIPPDATSGSPVSVVPSTTGSDVSAAIRVVQSHGYTPNDTDDYAYPDFRYGLHVIIASVTGSADGYTRRAFFFVHGRYIGTDLADPSAIVRIVWRDDTTVALGYSIYKPDDAMCCPLGGEVTVRYRWTGTHLVAVDPIPSVDSRR